MKTNMGSIDKLIRLGIAIVLIVLYYKEILTGTLGIVALVLALVLQSQVLSVFARFMHCLELKLVQKKT